MGDLMSVYQLNKLMRDLSRSREISQRCRSELDAVLKDYDLSEDEKGAVTGWRVRKLYDLGVNPFLLLMSSMAMGKNIREYVAALRQEKQDG
jgi:hypothetical protein